MFFIAQMHFTHLSSPLCPCFIICLMKQSHAPCVEELSSAVPGAVEPWFIGETIDGGDGS